MADARLHFQEELREIERSVLETIGLVVEALDRAMEAVENQDVELASMVIADDDRIDGRYLDAHQRILSLLALQAPVATDLRTVAALLHVVRHVERMGDQCVNIAKLIPLSGYDPPTEPQLIDRIRRMGSAVRAMIDQAREAFARRDIALAEDLVTRDDEVDRLNRECFAIALEVGADDQLREWAMYMMLIARAIERLGDNAVDIGEQTAFVVTGLFREFTDASHPSWAGGAPAAS